jgi:hypothetical protein
VKLGNVDFSGQQIMNLWKMRHRISKREGIPIDSRDDTETVLGSIIHREIDRILARHALSSYRESVSRGRRNDTAPGAPREQG